MNKTRKRNKKLKKRKKTRKINKDMCSPKLKDNKVENTCYNKKSLLPELLFKITSMMLKHWHHYCHTMNVI